MPEPLSDQNVLPRQRCPAFLAREGALPGEVECWFCAYADFHIDKAKTLDVGVCNYPKLNGKVRVQSHMQTEK